MGNFWGWIKRKVKLINSAISWKWKNDRVKKLGGLKIIIYKCWCPYERPNWNKIRRGNG